MPRMTSPPRAASVALGIVCSVNVTASTWKVAGADVLPGVVVTVTAASPGGPGGWMKVHLVSVQVSPLIAAPPKVTWPDRRSVPLRVILAPPEAGPPSGDSVVIVGAGGTAKVNLVAAVTAEGPASLCAVTSTVPAACAPVVTTQLVRSHDAPCWLVPNQMLVPVRSVPVTVTSAPPTVDPVAGETEVMVGTVGRS